MRLLVLVLALILWPAAAFAQALPNHVDPSARESTAPPPAVPAIRFLTTADFPPFNYRDTSGELIGFNIDLARAICAEINVACTIQAWPWEQIADALADNQGDALIAGLAITPENGSRFDFSSIYLMLPGRFVTRVEDSRSFDPTALTGAAVSVRRGTTHAEFIRRYVHGARIVEFDTEVQALEALSKGEVTAYFGDALRASFWLNANVGCCDFAGKPYFRPGLFGEGLAIAVPSGNDPVRQAIDIALERLHDDGTMDELYLRWFPVSFY
jgi:polar amino acid transport system substrate-binding protein